MYVYVHVYLCTCVRVYTCIVRCLMLNVVRTMLYKMLYKINCCTYNVVNVVRCMRNVQQNSMYKYRRYCGISIGTQFGTQMWYNKVRPR